MNSLQQHDIPKVDTPEAFVALFEGNLEMLGKVDEVELIMKKLKFLGLNFDPFGPEVSDECRKIMDNLGLTQHLTNPYLATNILLRLLDKTEERLKKLEQ